MKFNIRVYGIVLNAKNQILIADEQRKEYQFTKFPGGGLEFGEGTIDCLKREFVEELNQDIVDIEHYYTTDYNQLSAFNKNEQLISIYYKVKLKNENDVLFSKVKFDFQEVSDEMISFRWLHLQNFSESDVTFPIDKKVAKMIIDDHK